MHTQFRQGDVLVTAIRNEELPKDLVKAATDSQGRIVLAYGELTGHAHAIASNTAELFLSLGAEESGALRRSYLVVGGDEPVALRHEEHAPILIPPGTHLVTLQREYEWSDIPRPVAD